MDFGDEVHFHLQLGDLSGFRRLDPNKKLALFLHGWNDQGSKDWVQELLLSKSRQARLKKKRVTQKESQIHKLTVVLFT